MPQHTLFGTGAPASTPTDINAHYVNTTNGDRYISNGTSSVADWGEPLGSGGGSFSVPGSRILQLDAAGTLQTCNLSEDYDNYNIRMDDNGATWAVILPDIPYDTECRFRFSMYHTSTATAILSGVTLHDFGGVSPFTRTNLSDIVADFTSGNTITFELTKVVGSSGLYYWRYRLLDTFAVGGS